MSNKVFLKWEDINIKWEDLNNLWEDISIFIEVDNVIRRGGGYADYVKGNPWDKLKRDIGEEKTKRFIKIWCKYKNIDYEKEVEINDNIKVTASDFEFFIKENIRESIRIKVNI
jgi:hypothetical protein